ncbi:MAG: biotin--[acetyl-CoA-carboxylase] ligase [Candidatus Brocadiae bacterium]|nr:biotin--[acetyl-CoA-carboxylase] ligase [Candidatus Brocadiia bacterium]
MLDVAAIQKLLDPQALIGPVRSLSSVSSTNDIAWAWATAGCAEGAVYFAEEQVQGRGRFGRTWLCPRGAGLLMSVVLRPSDPAITPAHLTALTALAASEAVEEVAGLQAVIQWPNDVMVAGRKLAGVLVERRGGAGTACVAGVGMNVNVAPAEFPEAVRAIATSLSAAAGHTFVREEVAAALLRRLDARYRQTGQGAWDQVAAAWRQRGSLVGEDVEVECAGATWHGTVVAVDPVAGIELELRGGERRAFVAERTTVLSTSHHAAAEIAGG